MIFKELHRLSSPLDIEADPSMEITSGMTIKEWRISGDLMRWQGLAKWLNEEFEIDVELEQWKAVLEPARKRKLIEVCDLISSHSVKRPIHSIKIFGHQCASAGLFRYITSELKIRGVDVVCIKPSSPMSDYLSHNYEALLPIIARLKSGVIESLAIVRSKKERSIWQKLNPFDEARHEIQPIGVTTFRDYIMKLI